MLQGLLGDRTTSHGGLSSQDYRTDGARSCAGEAARRQSEQTNSPIRKRRFLCPVRAEQMRRNVRVKTNWKRHKNPRTLEGASTCSAGADVDMRVMHAGAGWQYLFHEVCADIDLFCASNCPCAFGHSTRVLDMVLRVDDFIVAGCGDDLDLAVSETG